MRKLAEHALEASGGGPDHEFAVLLGGRKTRALQGQRVGVQLQDGVQLPQHLAGELAQRLVCHQLAGGVGQAQQTQLAAADGAAALKGVQPRVEQHNHTLGGQVRRGAAVGDVQFQKGFRRRERSRVLTAQNQPQIGVAVVTPDGRSERQPIAAGGRIGLQQNDGDIRVLGQQGKDLPAAIGAQDPQRAAQQKMSRQGLADAVVDAWIIVRHQNGPGGLGSGRIPLLGSTAGRRRNRFYHPT